MILSLIATLALTAAPQDRAYCTALAEAYTRYLAETRRPEVEPRVAITECRDEIAWAIAVLERRLRNGRIALPPRG